MSGSLQGAGGIGGLLARTDHSTLNLQPSTAHAYYHADGNGNITYLVNSSQGLAASYRYDPYGNVISQSGSLAWANAYRFSSKEFHAASGLYYFGYRWYAPSLQRWLNRDPIGEEGGINLYSYVGNNPISNIDPLGLDIYKVQYPGWPPHEGIIGDNPDTGGYWHTDFGPKGGKAITGPGQYGNKPWSWPPGGDSFGLKVKCRVRTTPDVDRALRDRAASDDQGPAPRYWCLGNNCWAYAHGFVNQANSMMNPLITVPPSFNTVVNTPVVNIHLRP